jgi:DNA ligase-1
MVAADESTTELVNGKNTLTTSEIIDVDLFEADSPPNRAANKSDSPTRIQVTGTRDAVSPSVIQFSAPSPNFIAFADLSVDPVIYTPDSQPWPSRSTPYSFLAHALASISATRSRIIIINVLTNTLHTIILHDPTSLLSAIYLLSNTLAPSYTPVELGLGASIISRSIQHVSGLTAPALKRLYTNTGDVGDVAFTAKSNLRTLVPHPPLLINYVYKSLLSITCCKGSGAAKDKQKIVEKLLISATGEEVRFLARTLTQNLRVGAVRASILTALSRAMVLTPLSHFGLPATCPVYHASIELLSNINPHPVGKIQNLDKARDELGAKFMQAESLIKRVYVQHPNYEHITAALLRTGLDGLEESVVLTLGELLSIMTFVCHAYLLQGIPLHPTLGSPTRSLEEIYDLLGDRPFTAEFKYDGQRAQIHGYFSDGRMSVKIFSRHLEDMTSKVRLSPSTRYCLFPKCSPKYPDIVSMVECIFNTRPEITSFILDSEIVAVDASNGSLRSFQELSNRARKDVQLKDIQVFVCVFAFDLMYFNGEVREIGIYSLRRYPDLCVQILLERAFRDRRSLLRARFPPFVPPLKWAARLDHVEACESELGRGAIENFWEKALDSRCEGLMVKVSPQFHLVHEIF